MPPVVGRPKVKLKAENECGSSCGHGNVLLSVDKETHDADEIEVNALPWELFVEAKTAKRIEARRDCVQYGRLKSRFLYRRFDLTLPIDADKVTAHIDKGQLTIEAPKKVLKPIAVRAAAA